MPGALLQSLVATLLGIAVGLACGWGVGGGLVLGLAVSVASTVVLVRGLLERRLLETPSGRVAVGWLVVEDLLTVVMLVLLPVMAGSLGGVASSAESAWLAVTLSLLKVGGLIVLVFLVGRRVIPWILERVARAESRELFTLSVLAIALGVACVSSWLAGVSLALGAFLGGMVVAQSDLSHQAASDSIPLRDAFAVLFFVSVGMLFEAKLVLSEPLLLAATLGIILIAKPLVALLLVVFLGHPLRMALTVAMGLAQVGEFSFILARMGQDLGLLPQAGHDAVLAGALLSIAINPVLLRTIEPVDAWLQKQPVIGPLLARLHAEKPGAATPLVVAAQDHVILCGAGRVGTVVTRVLVQRGWSTVVVELDRSRATRLRERGVQVVQGDAASSFVLDQANVQRAALLVIAFDDPVSARIAVDDARRKNPSLHVIVRVSSRTERDRFESMDGVQAVMGEFEAALEMTRKALVARGLGSVESQAVIVEMRRADRGSHGEAQPVLVEISVPASSPAVGKTLASLDLPPTTRVVVVRRGADQVIARGQTVLEAGDTLLVVADEAGLRPIQRAIEPRAPSE